MLIVALRLVEMIRNSPKFRKNNLKMYLLTDFYCCVLDLSNELIFV